MASKAFRNSKRLSDFLRYVVQETLEGRGDTLKERTIGVRVFGREPDYDTGSDATVRISAGELRKRIAQYYHEPGHADEVRIDFPAGSYHPIFRAPLPTVLPRSDAGDARAPEEVLKKSIPGTVWFRRRRWQFIGLAITILSAYAVISGVKAGSQKETVDRFWSPLLESPGSVLILIGGGGNTRPPAQDATTTSPAPGTTPVSIDDYQRTLRISIGDALTLAQLTNLLGQYTKPYEVEYSRLTDLTRLRTAPLVLIGAFGNQWTRELTGSTRFYFEWDKEAQTEWIADRNNKSRRDWQVSNTAPYKTVTEDYAIVGRFRDAATEHPVVIAGGLKIWGTRAAGEFLTKPAYMNELMKAAPKTWKGVNVEAVIATRIINGVSGPPRVAAVEFW